MEFKGTKGKLEPKYVSGICIGIGTVGDFSQITANSILPETDKEYNAEKEEIEANMLLYSKAPELLEFLIELYNDKETYSGMFPSQQQKLKELIKSATEI